MLVSYKINYNNNGLALYGTTKAHGNKLQMYARNACINVRGGSSGSETTV